jgi:hypothetical protein
METEDLVCAAARYMVGAFGTIEATTAAFPGFPERIEIVGLRGTATLAGTGVLDWTGGTIEGNLTIGHGVKFHASGFHDDNGRRALLGTDYLSGGVPATVTNHGTMSFDHGATVGTLYRAKLVNASDGTLTLAPGVVFGSGSCCVNPDQIVNNGTVVVPAGTTTTAAELDNVAYKSTGTTSVASGRRLLLSGGATGRLSGASLAGAGTLAISTPMAVSGTNTVSAGAHLLLQDRNLHHGSLNGTATFSGAGKLQWQGGAFSGAVTVAVGGGVTVNSADPKVVPNINGGSKPSKLTFNTRVTIAAGTKLHHDGIDFGYSTVTFRKATTVGRFVDLYGGKLINAGTLTVRPGTLERGGSPRTVNSGTLSLAAGATLHTTGGYSQTSHGTLVVHLGAHGHGLLSVQESVALHGKLAARDDGSYNPGVGKRVQVVTASNVAASPSCVTTSGAGSAHRHWVAGKNVTGLVLTRRAGAHRHC